MISQYCIYRYIDKKTKEILYVGKTDTSLENRINQHQSETKFKNIDAEVEYIELKNNMETRFYEFYFINKWKPVLNTADKYEDELDCDIIHNFEWKLYVPEVKEKKIKMRISWQEELLKEKQKYIEEGSYFDLKHITLNNLSNEAKEIYVFLCKQYLQTENYEVCFDKDSFPYDYDKERTWALLAEIHTHSLKYIRGSVSGGYNYISYRSMSTESFNFKVHMNDCLKNEWIEDLVVRYDAGELI